MLRKQIRGGVWILGGPPSARRKDDKYDKGGRRGQDDADGSNRKKSGKFDRYDKADKDQDSRHGSQEVMEDMELYETQQTCHNDLVPIAFFDPTTGCFEIVDSETKMLTEF